MPLYQVTEDGHLQANIISIPTKSSADRDALNPAEGWLIFNTETKRLEIFVGTEWWPIQTMPIISGTTSELNSNPINECGCFAYDTTLKRLKVKKNGVWKKLKDEDDA
jgi:hypothetical protein